MLNFSKWQNHPEYSLGVLSEIAIHGVDLARFLIKSKIIDYEVNKNKLHPKSNVWDNSMIRLLFENGCTAHICSSLTFPYFDYEFTLYGTNSL